MLTETTTLIALFLIYTTIREYLHYRQTTKLQELLKSLDITEYYKAVRPHQTEKKSPVVNQIMEEQNQIAFDDPEFDPKKISKVIIDGEERPIEIL